MRRKEADELKKKEQKWSHVPKPTSLHARRWATWLNRQDVLLTIILTFFLIPFLCLSLNFLFIPVLFNFLHSRWWKTCTRVGPRSVGYKLDTFRGHTSMQPPSCACLTPAEEDLSKSVRMWSTYTCSLLPGYPPPPTAPDHVQFEGWRKELAGKQDTVTDIYFSILGGSSRVKAKRNKNKVTKSPLLER